MKKVILLTCVLLSSLLNAQKKDKNNDATSFTYSSDGLNPNSLTMSVKDMPKDELEVKIKDWFDLKSGKSIEEEIIGATGKGKKAKKIKIKGLTHNVICIEVENTVKCEDVEYEIDITVEDGSYEFKPKKLKYNSGKGKKDVNISFKINQFHSADGKIIKGFSKVPSQIEDFFNKMNKSLYNYINDIKQEDEW